MAIAKNNTSKLINIDLKKAVILKKKRIVEITNRNNVFNELKKFFIYIKIFIVI